MRGRCRRRRIRCSSAHPNQLADSESGLTAQFSGPVAAVAAEEWQLLVRSGSSPGLARDAPATHAQPSSLGTTPDAADYTNGSSPSILPKSGDGAQPRRVRAGRAKGCIMAETG